MSEVSNLTESVEENLPHLRQVDLGSRFQLGQAQWQLLAGADKNVVYQIRAEETWYLKVSRVEPHEGIAREEESARLVRRVLENYPNHQPACVRANVADGWMLSLAVKGIFLNNALYRASFLPTPSRRQSVLASFEKFGRMIGTLHSGGDEPNLPRFRKPTAREEFDGQLKRCSPDATMVNELANYAEQIEEDSQPALLHGNLRRENIFCYRDQVSLIDFEDCGTGSKYDELSKFVAGLLMLRTLTWFPWRLGAQAAGRFLSGYGETNNFNPAHLRDALLLRIGKQYLGILRGKKTTVMRIKVSKKATIRVLRALMDDSICQLAPGLMP